MMNESQRYSIEELARLAGVSRRTVRFYVQRGLIPPPLGRGRGNHYTDEHLERILQVRSLQREGVSLDRVDRVLQGDKAAPRFEPRRELVARVRLGEGVWIEFSGGRRVPPPGTLEKLAAILEAEGASLSKDDDEGENDE